MTPGAEFLLVIIAAVAFGLGLFAVGMAIDHERRIRNLEDRT